MLGSPSTLGRAGSKLEVEPRLGTQPEADSTGAQNHHQPLSGQFSLQAPVVNSGYWPRIPLKVIQGYLGAPCKVIG
jgi:hypothetical protein